MPLDRSLLGADLAIGQWVLDHGRQAGLGTDTLTAAPALYVPLLEGGKPLGVLAVAPTNPRRILLPEQRHLLETFASQIGLAVERAQLAETAEGARLDAERESLRNTLLASISHDLRTPLSVIAGAGSALAQHGSSLDEATRINLARSVETKAREMSDLVSNVLDLMRFESGHIVLRRDWQTLDDLVGAALVNLGRRAGESRVEAGRPCGRAAHPG
jgi:two-component system sensor histidine kinase KdpD